MDPLSMFAGATVSPWCLDVTWFTIFDDKTLTRTLQVYTRATFNTDRLVPFRYTILAICSQDDTHADNAIKYYLYYLIIR